jgi:DeoR/GlpR family transcriptional regulator of sugar metabolism
MLLRDKEETPAGGIMADERRALIMRIVNAAGRVKVKELAERFNISSVTIRNDLNELQRRGLVFRSHGGAVNPDTRNYESPFSDRTQSHSDEKCRIGILAATLLQDGETIILDSGTTTEEIAKQIKNRQHIQVITNGVNIANQLLGSRGVQTIILGGTLQADSPSIVGRGVEDMLSQLSADKLFLGAAGCDPEFGVSSGNLEESIVSKAMLAIARKVIVVADASKFYKRSISRVANFSEIDTVITDAGLPIALQERIRSFGCDLLLA